MLAQVPSKDVPRYVNRGSHHVKPTGIETHVTYYSGTGRTRYANKRHAKLKLGRPTDEGMSQQNMSTSSRQKDGSPSGALVPLLFWGRVPKLQ